MDEARESRVGRAIVILLALLILAGAAVVLLYKLVGDSAPVAMRFERVAAPAANATALAVAPAEKELYVFLDDHLDTAVRDGNSTESVRLRVERMAATLARATGSAGPEWWVRWDGHVVRVTLDGTL